MPEQEQASAKSSPKAGEIHPVAVRQIEADMRPPQQLYDTSTYDIHQKMRERKLRELENAEMTASKMEIEEDTELRKTRIRKAQLERQQIEEQLGDQLRMGVKNQMTKDEAIAAAAAANEPTLTDIDAKFAIGLSDLPAEKQAASLAAWKSMKSKANELGGDFLTRFMMLKVVDKIGEPQQQPQAVSSITDTINAVGSLLDRYQKQQPNASGDQAFRDKLMDKLLDRALVPPPQQDVTEIITKFSEAGLMYTPKQAMEMVMNSSKNNSAPVELGPSDRDIQFAQMKMDHDLKIAELQQNSEFKKEELALKKSKDKNVESLLTGVASTIGTYFGQGEVQGLKNLGMVTPPDIPVASTATYKCTGQMPDGSPCGNEILIPEPSKPRSITCVKCHNVIEYTPLPG